MNISPSFLIVSAVFVGNALLFRYLWARRESRLKKTGINLSIFLFTVCALFLILEYVFSSVLFVSDGLNFTLSSQRWFEKYWHPINSFGYRDYEHRNDDIKNKKIVFVVHPYWEKSLAGTRKL